MTTRTEAIELVTRLKRDTPGGWRETACWNILEFIAALPPEPFVMPPPGTEFTVQLQTGEAPRSFYRAKSGDVVEFYPNQKLAAYSEAWFRERGAVIVEAGQ